MKIHTLLNLVRSCTNFLLISYRIHFIIISGIHDYQTIHKNDLNLTKNKKVFSNNSIRTSGPFFGTLSIKTWNVHYQSDILLKLKLCLIKFRLRIRTINVVLYQFLKFRTLNVIETPCIHILINWLFRTQSFSHIYWDQKHKMVLHFCKVDNGYYFYQCADLSHKWLVYFRKSTFHR